MLKPVNDAQAEPIEALEIKGNFRRSPTRARRNFRNAGSRASGRAALARSLASVHSVALPVERSAVLRGGFFFEPSTDFVSRPSSGVVCRPVSSQP